MSVTITDEAMLYTDSPHWAWPEGTDWIVSWSSRMLASVFPCCHMRAGARVSHGYPRAERRIRRCWPSIAAGYRRFSRALFGFAAAVSVQMRRGRLGGLVGGGRGNHGQYGGSARSRRPLWAVQKASRRRR